MESNLEEEIELMRKVMMDVARREGRASAETMECSRILDNLINEFDARKEQC